MRRVTSIALLSSVVLLAAVVYAADMQPKAAIGQAAPAFTLQDQDGKTVTLSDSAGKVVVLEWWNNECPIDARHYGSDQAMNKLASKWAEKGVVWLAVNSTKNKTNADNKKAAESWKMARPVLNDASGDIGHAYGATNTPHMYVIDSKGSVVYMGAIDDNPQGDKKDGITNYVDKALTELTAGTQISTPQTKAYGCSVKYAK
jgi:peroxiredoxin